MGGEIILGKDLLEKLQISIAYGKAEFKMNRGSFHHKDKLRWRKRLTGGRVIETELSLTKTLLNDRGEEVGSITLTGNEIFRIHLELKDKENINRLWVTLPARTEEKVYGCGECFSKFNLRGESVRIWVAEHQNAKRITNKIIKEKLRGSKPNRILPFSKYETYYAQPTFVSSEKYFVHVSSDAYMEFNFTQSNSHTLMIRDIADIMIGFAPSFEQLSVKLSGLLGRQRKLPDWIYDGAILGMQGGTRVVEEKLEKAKKANMRIAGIWCQDWEGCRITKFGYQLMWNWKWDDQLYPGLDKKIKDWRNEGIHFLGYINPFLAIEKELYHYASKKGYCVKNQAGLDYMVTITTFPAVMVDFTNPKAYEWIKGIIKTNLIGFGLDGWMADFAEYLPTDCVLYSGESPELIHNTWPAIWAKINREAIDEMGKAGEVFFFTRAGHTNSIRYSTMMWNGDQHVDWSMDDGIASVIPGTLSLAMSGYGITHSDIGGYTTIMHMKRDSELLIRWAEMNAFSPLFRSHEGNRPGDNIQYDSNDEVLKHVAAMSRCHAKLGNYLKECVTQQEKMGLPVIRPLFYHYEESQAFDEAYEYLLGRDILVAPVIRKGERIRKVYLPQDQWVHLFTGESYSGGYHMVEAEYGKPPVFIRRDSTYYKELVGME